MLSISELKRRNVFRVAALYLVAAWLLLQVAGVLSQVLGVPGWAGRVVFLLVALGFPVALAIAWVYEITPEGLKRAAEVDIGQSIAHVTARKLNLLIGVLAAVAIGAIVADRLIPDPSARVADTAPGRGSESEHVTDKSIAVLPFINMSSDPEQEYFADGLSEELLNALARIPELRVIARTSAFVFKDTTEDVRTIGEKLSVGHILRGSVRRAANRIRVTAHLVRTDDSSHLWSQSYDRDLSDIFEVQDEISRAVVQQLKVVLLDGARYGHGTQNTEAYSLYLQGRFQATLQTPEGARASEEHYKKALELDPEFAQAWAGIALAYFQTQLYADVSDPAKATEYAGLARQSAERAVQIDPQAPEGHIEVARISHNLDWDWAGAERSVRRALELDPRNGDALSVGASILMTTGRFDEAERLIEQSMISDPLSPTPYRLLASIQNAKGLHELAEATLRKLQAFRPELSSLANELGQTLLLQDNAEAALAILEHDKREFWRKYGLALAYHSNHDSAQSDLALKWLIDGYSQRGAYQIACVYAWRNQRDLALEWLDRAWRQRDGGLRDILIEPAFRILADDPGYRALLRKMNLPARAVPERGSTPGEQKA